MFTIKLTPEEINHLQIALEMNKILKEKLEIETNLVGGSCRDLMVRHFFNIHKNINDLDFTIFKNGIGLNVDELIEVKFILESNMKNCNVLIEDKFLHLKCMINDKIVEYTSLRGELYPNNMNTNDRKPEVWIGDINSDFFRRDFMCNTVYLSIKSIEKGFINCESANEISDKCIEDIKNKKLNTTTEDPNEVMKIDPLRLLRFFRFCGDFPLTKEVN